MRTSFSPFRTLLISAVLLARPATGHGQGQWVWEHGNSDVWMEPGPPGVFGPTYTPGTRYAMACWTDSAGLFWMYGAEEFSDLWAFDPSILQWARVDTGTSIVGSPVYGTMGAPGPLVNPGPAIYGHPAWVGQNDRLWLYGPSQTSDTWRYDIASGEWTWMNGPAGFAPAVYGTQGVPAPANIPGLVNETACEWVDANGDLWLFNEFDGVTWRFDVTLAQWVWERGIANGPPVYGTLGTPAPANEPGASANCPFMGTLWTMWQDANYDFWMTLNRGSGANTNAEIWKYFTALGQWACMRIDAVPAFTTVQTYGTQCVEDPNSAPIPKGETRTRWVDDCDRMWWFGGVAMCAVGTYIPDLWCFDPVTNNWTWIAGDQSSVANLGVQGVPSPSNWPEPNAGASHWVNRDGFWMFGGNANSFTSSNVLHYMPDTVQAEFTFVVDQVECQHVTFTDQSTTGCNKIKEHLWDFGDPNSGASNTSTLADPTHDFSGSGTYTVTLIVQNCTWDADTVQHEVTIICTTTVTLASDTICEGDCTALQAVVLGGTAPYTFAWDNGITDTIAGPINICPPSTTTYSVIAIDALGASDTATATITVVPPPVVDLGADTTLCAPPLLLNAGNGGSTYLWQNGSTAQAFNATTSGTYWVQVNNGACVSMDSIVVQFEGPLVDLGPDTITCFPAMLLDAGNADFTHLWQDGSTAQTFTTTGPGTYWVAITDLNGCTVSDTITITLDDPDIDLGPYQLLCDSNIVLLDAGPDWTTYTWQDGSFLQTFQPNATGTYWVTATLGDCVAIDTVNVAIYDPEAIPMVNDTSGCPPLIVQFTDASVAPGEIIVGWNWSFGDGGTSNTQDPPHLYDQPGVYQASLIITTDHGCADTTVLTPSILIYPIPGANFQFTPPSATIENATIHFTDNSIGAVQWLWDFGDGDSSTVQNPEHIYLASGTYTVTLTVINEFGCEAVISYMLVVNEVASIYVPNAFTPNGDGINDLFVVQGTGLSEVDLLIFNRWGELIFDEEGLGRGWDGTYRGQVVKDGVYEYKVRYRMIGSTGRHQAIGHVTVLR